MPDFEAWHWLAWTGQIANTPLLATSRAQMGIALDTGQKMPLRIGA